MSDLHRLEMFINVETFITNHQTREIFAFADISHVTSDILVMVWNKQGLLTLQEW